MRLVTKHHPHDYLPATGHGSLLPAYDLIARLMGFKRVYPRLIAQAELADGQRVLEIGCGTGTVIIGAKRSQPGIDAVGIDPDPQILSRARRKADGLSAIQFEQGYAQQLPHAEREFDRVLSSMMLHHVSAEAKPLAASEVFRVLRPGGRLHLVDIGGHIAERPGPIARLIRSNPRTPPDAVPELLHSAGFDCKLVDVQPHRLLGQLLYYRATRPA